MTDIVRECCPIVINTFSFVSHLAHVGRRVRLEQRSTRQHAERLLLWILGYAGLWWMAKRSNSWQQSHVGI